MNGQNFGQQTARALMAWFNADHATSDHRGEEWTVYRDGKSVSFKMPNPKDDVMHQADLLRERMERAKRQLDEVAP